MAVQARHRLVFSNGIILLTVLALTLLLVVGANINALSVLRDRRVHRVLDGRVRDGQVPPEDEGARLAPPACHQRHGRGVYGTGRGDLRDRQVHRGAWLVVVVFPVLVFAFIRLNRRYRVEAEVLEDIGGRKPPDPPN